ncbi:receptor-like protein kinase [Trifolium medium]|uniref:Receptor-like protein kinase n=1 Tax=Trifolium medium TaxID=97028 RepID=A0A392QE19_9FABA|nr:receptor-like protein kinase [Trifolium medium]
MRLRRLPHQQYCGRNYGCGPQFKTLMMTIGYLLLLLLSLTTFHKTMSSNDHKLVECNEKDQETLLIFKNGINDSYNGKISTRLTEKDCCAWEGVHCDNITGRVTELHLREHDLKVTQQNNITHASNLFYLDLSFNFGDLHMDNFDWLSPLL